MRLRYFICKLSIEMHQNKRALPTFTTLDPSEYDAKPFWDIQTPLQALSNNLEYSTYESDPIKYSQYVTSEYPVTANRYHVSQYCE